MSKNKTISTRKYLTKTELEIFFKWLKTSNQYDKPFQGLNLRNYLIFRLLYLHGMRVSEVINLRWSDIDLDTGLILVRRLKDSMTTNQIMQSSEVKELRRLRKLKYPGSLVICNSDGTQLCRQAVNYISNKASKELGIEINPHKLKHTCGVHLATTGKNIKEIQYHLGHKQINNTLIYLDYSPTGDANNLI